MGRKPHRFCRSWPADHKLSEATAVEFNCLTPKVSRCSLEFYKVLNCNPILDSTVSIQAGVVEAAEVPEVVSVPDETEGCNVCRLTTGPGRGRKVTDDIPPILIY